MEREREAGIKSAKDGRREWVAGGVMVGGANLQQ